jgi:hypothetical protein
MGVCPGRRNATSAGFTNASTTSVSSVGTSCISSWPGWITPPIVDTRMLLIVPFIGARSSVRRAASPRARPPRGTGTARLDLVQLGRGVGR